MNNWYVITGAPNGGKTTILNLLQKKGYKIIPEASRTYIDQESSKGKTINQIRGNELQFQKILLEMKVATERTLEKDQIIFFDRGIPDSIAYYEICGITSDSELQNAIRNCNYKKVFLFEMLEYRKDYARTENSEKAKKIQELLRKSYERLHMEVLFVPVMTIEKRLQFILDNL